MGFPSKRRICVFYETRSNSSLGGTGYEPRYGNGGAAICVARAATSAQS